MVRLQTYFLEKEHFGRSKKGRIILNCPVCNSPVPDGQQFCPACGTHIPSQANNGQMQNTANGSGMMQRKGSSLAGRTGNSGYAGWFKGLCWAGAAVCLAGASFSLHIFKLALNYPLIYDSARGPSSIAEAGFVITMVGFVLMALQKLDDKKQQIIVGFGCFMTLFDIVQLGMAKTIAGTQLVPMGEILLYFVIAAALPVAAIICIQTGKADA